MLGALVVLTDITALKRLELQIRRSDRLASLGTLSAGMAHEIKNPLVSIKTFAQLLPERYQDSDFRETFSNLIGHEIDRIDSLVNQLLRFARPAKPVLKPMHVHEVLEKSLQLVGHRLYQKEIKLTRSWQADVDTIRADADQLEQVFLNFFLNAMDAMNRGGELNVVDGNSHRPRNGSRPSPARMGDAHEVLRVTIRDNGEGIRRRRYPARLRSIFHDEGLWNRARVVGRPRHHPGTWRADRSGERTRRKARHFHILAPAGSLRTGGGRGMSPPPICILYSQDARSRPADQSVPERAGAGAPRQPAGSARCGPATNRPALLLIDLRAKEAAN